jgi:guanylate kinase
MKVTTWFPHEIDPVHIGCYQTRYNQNDIISYNYWNGNFWLTTTAKPEKPKHNSQSLVQEIQWRGIKKEKK